MKTKITNFIKYNNATVIIVLFIFLFGASVFASEDVRSAVINKESEIRGVDNSLLLSANIDNLDMDFKINKIEEDDNFYYTTYTYIDLVEENNAWQYSMKEKTRKISKKIKKDLSVFLGEELVEEYEQRKKELAGEKKKALLNGVETRVEVVKYGGIIGKALDVGSKIFPGYSAVRKNTMPSPDFYLAPIVDLYINQVDEISSIYNNYIEDHAEEIIALDEVISTSTSTSTINIATSSDIIMDIVVEEVIAPSLDIIDVIIEEPINIDIIEEIIPSSTVEDIIQ